MGRTDEVQFLLECSRAWQSRGARVTFQAGWESRGNGLQGNYEGCIVHHTAFVSSAAKQNPALSTLINGRPDLQGPLCNATSPWSDSPWLHVIAAYPANHAGASGGRSMGPLPVTSLFNPRVLGLEIDYAGVSPMNPGQYQAGLIFARGVADVLGRSTEYARGHAETSITGKWDPGYALNKTIDMAAFRRDAANVQQEDDMALTDDDIVKLWYGPRFRGDMNYAQVIQAMQDGINAIARQTQALDLSGRPGGATDDQYGHILSLRAEVEALAAKVNGGTAPASGPVQISAADRAAIVKDILDGLKGRLEA